MIFRRSTYLLLDSVRPLQIHDVLNKYSISSICAKKYPKSNYWRAVYDLPHLLVRLLWIPAQAILQRIFSWQTVEHLLELAIRVTVSFLQEVLQIASVLHFELQINDFTRRRRGLPPLEKLFVLLAEFPQFDLMLWWPDFLQLLNRSPRLLWIVLSLRQLCSFDVQRVHIGHIIVIIQHDHIIHLLD